MNTVLVVDDKSEIRDIIRVYLRNEGYQVIEIAADVRGYLLKPFQTSSIQLVILDIIDA